MGEDAHGGNLIGASGVANTVSTNEDLRTRHHLIYVAKKATEITILIETFLP